MKKKKQKLFIVGVVAWVMLSFIFFYQNTDSNLTFFCNFVLPTSTQGSMRPIDAPHVESNSITEQLKDKERHSARAIVHPVMQPNLNLGYSWADNVVRGLWMGWASSDMLSSNLQKAKKDYTAINLYRVTFKGHWNKQRDRKQLLCQLKKHGMLRTLIGSEEPFASLGWQKLVPRQPLEQAISGPYRTCAVVASAAAILHSSLGREIDSHDAVLRFNAAPTEGYENDVGSRTTIRIINSQWYEKPDHDLFTAYKEHRMRDPSQPFYILHPDFLWNLWNILQSNTEENVQPNPPSSGFIGIILMMSICDHLDVYEFIPSKRHTTLCHYYDQYHDFACTLGAYHPLFYEKLFIRRLTTVPLVELIMKGKVTLPGFSQITCPGQEV